MTSDHAALVALNDDDIHSVQHGDVRRFSEISPAISSVRCPTDHPSYKSYRRRTKVCCSCSEST